MGEISKRDVSTLFVPSNANTRDLAVTRLRPEARRMGLPEETLRSMLDGEAPYFKLCDTPTGVVAAHVVAAEDMGQAIAATPNSVGLMYIDLLIDYLYDRGRCPSLFDSSGKPRDPRTILPRRIFPGKRLTFALRNSIVLDVEVLPFDQTQLPRLVVLVPRVKKRSWRHSGRRDKAMRVICELRYQHIAHAFLKNAVGRYELITVFRKTEGYVLARRAHIAVDVTVEGRTARRNGLRPALTIINSYPVVVKNGGTNRRHRHE